jgi:hypothetical protein
MNPEFDELIDTDDLSEEERRRLESVHAMLVAAGPPPDLPAALRDPPRQVDGTVVELAPRRRARRTAWALIAIAATLVLASFGGGYLLGDRLGSSSTEVVRVVPMQGVGQPARAEVSLEHVQRGGNWPMVLTVTGLPKQSSDHAYYELFVWHDGKPGFPCVGFKVHNGTTTVRFSVPYELTEGTQLVVTAIEPGKVGWPGSVVMRTV